MNTLQRSLLALLLTSSVAHPAAPSDILRADAECPKTHDVACFESGLTKPTPQIAKQKDGSITKTYTIEGSLNGGPTKRYRLVTTQPPGDYFSQTNNSGDIAFLGVIDGSPHVLTSGGALLILSTNVALERAPHVIVVNAKTDKVLARYYDRCVDIDFLTDSTKAMWDEGRKACIAADNRPTPKCKRPRVTEECERFRLGLVPAPMTSKRLHSLVREWRALDLEPIDESQFGGSGWLVTAYRVPGTDFELLEGYCADCVDEPASPYQPENQLWPW